ncbi:MAG: EAL domain-containing protein [gamma proteobacterium symbiont of Taylorina sp.]|nr:EAL domain-containing protein [gamma proteobacterium symbiont of Taylorina sp.]
MTLFKQILIIICVIFFTLFVSTFFVSTENIRDYLNEQLSSHAQDAATSLGIALTAEIGDNDIASMETYTNAMFDSGYYKEIIIKDIDEKILFQKDRPVIIDEVPDWFISLFPLHAPHQQASVESGWQTVGTITIQSYPGFAYKKLWENALNTLQLYLFVMFSILLVTAFALKFLLKPLLAIRQQAEAICNREFPIIDIKPKTIEFLHVVTALNKMSRKLKEIFTEQAKMTEDLQKQAFQDGLTGLPNRSIFIKQLKYFCDSKNETKRGCLVIMQLDDLVKVNKEYGHLKANDLLKQLAALLNKTSEDFPNSLVARLSGSEFVLLIKSITPELIDKLGKSLQNELGDIAKQLEFKGDDIAHIGMVMNYNNQQMGDLLSDADLALKLAQQKGINAFHLYDNEHAQTVQTQGTDEWHDIINNAIANDWFQLYFQKTVDTEDQTAFQEIMLRLNYENQVISAGIFIPMAEHLDITRFVDRWVIEKIIERIQSGSETAFCINLSRDTIQDPAFPIWLKDQVSELSTQKQSQLVIEMPEYNVIKALPEYKNLLIIMEPYACQFSIDHFGIGFASMSYLQDLKIDYIKVHGSYASNIQDNNDIVNYMRQIISTAHNLDIKIIAEGIEKEEDLKSLKELNLDYYQGYFIGRPEPEEQ